jgi:hypothetical protein
VTSQSALTHESKNLRLPRAIDPLPWALRCEQTDIPLSQRSITCAPCLHVCQDVSLSPGACTSPREFVLESLQSALTNVVILLDEQHGRDDVLEPHMNAEHSPGADSPEDRSRKHDALIARLLSDPERQEALRWLKAGGPDDERSIGGCETNQESIQFVQELYDLGASQVLAVNIHSNRNETGQYTGKLARLSQLAGCERRK